MFLLLYTCTCRPRKKSRVLKTSKKTSSSRFAPLIPLRRSKREKRLIFANFTPQEIDNTIQNRSTLMVESSDVSVDFTLLLLL